MTDAEVVCTFMGDPKRPGVFGAWWEITVDDHWALIKSPRPLTLDRLHEVEERLTEKQWLDYVDALIDLMPRFPRKGEIIHATAAQKLSALAKVLR